MQQTIVFSITPVTQMGQIMGPAPELHLCREGSVECFNTYSIYTNEENVKISAYLDSNMPKGTSLAVYLGPPQGARTMGAQMLSTIPVDLVVEISQVEGTGLPMKYCLKGSAKGGVIPSTTRTITYTLTGG